MPIVIPNVGEDYLLAVAFGKRAAESQTLRLFSSNTFPAEGDTAATYTESSGGGYAAIGLTGTSWANTITTGNGQVAYAQQTFSFTGVVGNVYGYYLTAASNTGLLIGAERFTDGPYNIQNNGDQIKITPIITGD